MALFNMPFFVFGERKHIPHGSLKQARYKFVILNNEVAVAAHSHCSNMRSLSLSVNENKLFYLHKFLINKPQSRSSFWGQLLVILVLWYLSTFLSAALVDAGLVQRNVRVCSRLLCDSAHQLLSRIVAVRGRKCQAVIFCD